MVKTEREGTFKEVGSAEWYASINPMSSQVKTQVARHMHEAAGSVFEDARLADLIFQCLKADSQLRKMEIPIDRIAETQAIIMGNIAQSVGLGKTDPLYQALAARRYMHVVTTFTEKLNHAAVVTTIKTDPQTGQRVSIATQPQQEKTQLQQALVVMQEKVTSFEELKLSQEEREKPDLLSYVFRIATTTPRAQVLNAIKQKKDWGPLQRRVARMKAQAATICNRG